MNYNYSVAGTSFEADERGKVSVPPTMKGKRGIRNIDIREYKELPENFITIQAEISKNRNKEEMR